MRQKFLYCILTFTFFSSIINAQEGKTPDALFQQARDEAFDNKDYDQAIAYAKQALSKSPEYTDIVIFLGRLYSWKKMPDSARYYFESAIEQNESYADVYAAYSDLERWNDNNDRSLEIVNMGLEYQPQSVPLLLRKTKLLIVKREYDSALAVVDTVLTIDKKNTEARYLGTQIRDNIAKNQIGLSYDYVYIDRQFPDDWQFVSLDYTRQTKLGSITARINYANRFARDGLQYEIESYPRFSKTFYGYISAGYSDEVGVFPKWRAGASLYANLPESFESEVGVRYLYFTDDVFIYTLYVGKYYRNFLFGARTYLTPSNNSGVGHAYNVTARYYYKGVDDYVGILLGAGLSPDDRRVNVQLNNPNNLRNYRAEATFRHSIKRLNIITADISLLNQEYNPDVVGNRILFGIGYIRRF